MEYLQSKIKNIKKIIIADFIEVPLVKNNYTRYAADALRETFDKMLLNTLPFQDISVYFIQSQYCPIMKLHSEDKTLMQAHLEIALRESDKRKFTPPMQFVDLPSFLDTVKNATCFIGVFDLPPENNSEFPEFRCVVGADYFELEHRIAQEHPGQRLMLEYDEMQSAKALEQALDAVSLTLEQKEFIKNRVAFFHRAREEEKESIYEPYSSEFRKKFGFINDQMHNLAVRFVKSGIAYYRVFSPYLLYYKGVEAFEQHVNPVHAYYTFIESLDTSPLKLYRDAHEYYKGVLNDLFLKVNKSKTDRHHFIDKFFDLFEYLYGQDKAYAMIYFMDGYQHHSIKGQRSTI